MERFPRIGISRIEPLNDDGPGVVEQCFQSVRPDRQDACPTTGFMGEMEKEFAESEGRKLIVVANNHAGTAGWNSFCAAGSGLYTGAGEAPL